MAFLLDTGIFASVGSDSSVMSGAKLYFYAAGTSTPLDTYTTIDLDPLSKNTNPAVADANGRFPPIWMVDALYKIRLTTSLDAPIETRDNVGSTVGADLDAFATSAGAGLLGFSHSATYTASTIGKTLQQREVCITDAPYSADPTGVSGASSAIETAISDLDADGGGKLIIPAGTFLVDTSINPVITNDLVVEFRGGKLVADTGLNVPVLHIRGASFDQAEPNDIHLLIVNPNIDCSDGTYTAGVSSNTAIAFNYMKTARVEGGYLYGGELPTNTNADSGISWVTCGEVVIDGVTIRGFADVGVYPGGNNTTGVGQPR